MIQRNACGRSLVMKYMQATFAGNLILLTIAIGGPICIGYGADDMTDGWLQAALAPALAPVIRRSPVDAVHW